MKNLNKNILAMSIAAAMVSGSVFAEGHEEAEASGPKVSGFIDVIYTAVDDGQTKNPVGKSQTEGKFLADGEIDVEGNMNGTTVRLDLDVRIAALAGGDNTGGAEIEQAFFAHPIGPVTLIGGVFNNPIGYEAEDAPDLDFTSHNIIYDILNNQTALHGNNVAGAALAGAIGPVTLTGAFLNDLGHAAEENSVALVANFDFSIFAIEAGYVTQDTQDNAAGAPTTAGDVFDVNAQFNLGMFSLGADVATFAEVLDPAIVVWGGVEIAGFAVKARYETVALEAAGSKDATQATLYASYNLQSNLLVALELRDGDVADSGLAAAGILANVVEGSAATVEFIGTF